MVASLALGLWARARANAGLICSINMLASNEATLLLHYIFHFYFPFSIVYLALGAIPGSPQLRVLTALYDLSTSRASTFSNCIFVDAPVAIYKIRVLVRYVCTRSRYVCTPSSSPPSPRGRISRLLPFGGGAPGNRLLSKPGGLATPPVCERGHFYFIGTSSFITSN